MLELSRGTCSKAIAAPGAGPRAWLVAGRRTPRGQLRRLVRSPQEDRTCCGRDEGEAATSHKSDGDGGRDRVAAEAQRRCGGRQAQLSGGKKSTGHSLLLRRYRGCDQ